jgi:carbon-monoxide dehydrogenase medium subunit
MEAETRPLPNFDYIVPSSLGETCKLRKSYQEKARLLAGGTDLLVKLKKRVTLHDVIIDLNRIPDLSFIKAVDDRLLIGGLTRLSQIQESPIVEKWALALFQAVQDMASPPIRNRATIAGNLCTSSPGADTAPPLLVLDASVRLVSIDGERTVPLLQFFVGPEQNVLRPDEILTEIILPLQQGRSAFIKLGNRNAFTRSVVSVAAFVKINNGKFEEVKVALGAVAPTPIRSRKVEEALKGTKASEQNIAKAAEAVTAELRPRETSLRASPAYRRDMACVLVRRVLSRAAMGGRLC